jgi:hypothetical protein
MRILMAGVLGGLTLFIWGAVSHMASPLGEAGLKSLPGEETVTAALRQSVPEAGLYFFPGMDMKVKMTPEQEKAWTERYRTGPAGLLVYRPIGGEPYSPRLFVVEGLSNILAATLAAMLLSMSAPGFRRRLLFGALLGAIGWMSVSVSYWNWYGFPASFILAEGVEEIIGWALAAAAMGTVLDRASQPAMPRAA